MSILSSHKALLTVNSAWGFLSGSEAKAAGAGNLGLQDRMFDKRVENLSHLHAERLALKWIKKYVSNFGGDPTKVTM